MKYLLKRKSAKSDRHVGMINSTEKKEERHAGKALILANCHSIILLPLVAWVLSSSFVAPQYTNIDSLLNVAQKTQKSRDWNNVAEYYNIHVDTLNLRLSAERSYKLAVQENDPKETGRALSLYGQYFDYIGRTLQALESFTKAKMYFEKADAKLHLAESIGFIGYYYNETGKYDQAITEFKKSIPLYQQVGKNDDQIARAMLNIGFSYLRKNMPDSVIFYNRQALKWAEIAHDTLTMIESSNQLGVLHSRKSEYTNALYYYEESLRLNRLSKNIQKIPNILVNISVLYTNWGNNEKAIEFAQKAKEEVKKCDDDNLKAIVFSISGAVFVRAKRPELAIETAKMSSGITRDLPYYQYTNLSTLAESYLTLDKIDSCERYLQKAEKFHEAGLFITESNYYFIKGRLLCIQKKYKDAIPVFEKGIEYRSKIEKRPIDKNVYNDLSFAYEKGLQDYKKALEYKELAYNATDSINKKEYILAMADFQTKYKTAEKELEITQLNLQQEQTKTEKARIVIWLVVIVALLVGTMLYNIILRQKKRTEKILLNQKLEEKEQEFDALVSDMEMRQVRSYLDGLEAERARLAGELHDNVSNALLGVEFKMRTPGVSQEEVSGMLHGIHEHVRNISHALMPPVFQHATLADIIADYVYMQNGMNGSRFECLMEPEDGWEDLPQETALELHRIIQEACGNALKHSGASLISIILQKIDGLVTLTVKDNGRGMDVNNKKAGLGLQIIRDRAAKMNSSAGIVSAPGKGTTITVTV